jgi:hypothetical protein
MVLTSKVEGRGQSVGQAQEFGHLLHVKRHEHDC